MEPKVLPSAVDMTLIDTGAEAPASTAVVLLQRKSPRRVAKGVDPPFLRAPRLWLCAGHESRACSAPPTWTGPLVPRPTCTPSDLIDFLY